MPLSILDDNRMIAQHREVHTVLGSALSTKHGFQNHPVVKQFLNEHLGCALDYHERTVKEMAARGWTGHATPLTDELYELAKANATSHTNNGNARPCVDWDEHVMTQVHMGPEIEMRGWHWDLHDLTERWTREEKPLRSKEAYVLVGQHRNRCTDLACQLRASTLRAEFSHREPGIALKGHKSLEFQSRILTNI